MSKILSIVIPLILAVGFLVYLIYASFGLDTVSCEVCVEFNGRMQCRRASATTEEDAIRSATDNACSLVTSGRDELMACSAAPPSSVSCQLP
jgi:hypothetical protein